ncbi:hypothetical protein Tco_0762364, partial [Tanacetum coccineum]
MAPLPPCDQRHLWLCYQVKGYTKVIVHDFEQRLETIFRRQEVFVSHAWRRLFEIRAPLFQEFILEFFSTCRIGSKMGIDDVRSLQGLVERLMIDQGRFSTWMVSCMMHLMEASGRTYQAFDGTLRGSYPAVFKRRTRCRTDGASTSTAQTKIDSKFSTIVCEHVMKPSKLSKSRAELRRESVYKSVEAEEKSKLKTC